MAQLSRPFQILLAATVLFALVWFVALRPHGSETTSSSPSPVASTPASTSAPTAASSASPAKSTPVYHGAAPGLEGLTRDINRAHGNVAASQSQAQKAASASGETAGQGPAVTASSTTAAVTSHKQPGASASTTVTSTTKSTTVVHSKHAAAVPAGTVTKSSVTVTKSSKRGAPSHSVTVTKTSVNAAPAQQVAVEKQLKQGKVVLVLFWNPKGSDDVAVHKELQAVEKQQGGKIAVHYALADQAGSFGSITKTIQVYQTPTILLVNGKGLTTTLTGFTDAFSIEQTIGEAREAA
jgi:hypothetical protein